MNDELRERILAEARTMPRQTDGGGAFDETTQIIPERGGYWVSRSCVWVPEESVQFPVKEFTVISILDTDRPIPWAARVRCDHVRARNADCAEDVCEREDWIVVSVLAGKQEAL